MIKKCVDGPAFFMNTFDDKEFHIFETIIKRLNVAKDKLEKSLINFYQFFDLAKSFSSSKIRTLDPNSNLNDSELMTTTPVSFKEDKNSELSQWITLHKNVFEAPNINTNNNLSMFKESCSPKAGFLGEGSQ